MFAEWMEYERLEPFGAPRDNYHAALIATILANAYRDRKRAPIKMAEFFYQDPDSAREAADMQMLSRLRLLKKH
jgi:hypothetical protein